MTVAMVNAYSATVKGGFFAQYGTTVAGRTGGGSLRKRARFVLSRIGTAPLREEMLTLDGATAGSTALKTTTRVSTATERGGKITVDTVTLLDDASVSGDVTRINADILGDIQYDSTPVANGNGNPLGSAGLF